MNKVTDKTILFSGTFLFFLSTLFSVPIKKSDNKGQNAVVCCRMSDAEKKIINTLLLEEPIFTISLMKTYKKASDILNRYLDDKNIQTRVAKNQDPVFKKDKEELLSPVKGLLANLHANKFITAPLFIKVLFDDETLEAIKSESKSKSVSLNDIIKNVDDVNLPIAIRFLSIKSTEASDFFDTHIQNTETLIKACQEFNTIFGEVNSILAPEVKQAAMMKFKELASKGL